MENAVESISSGMDQAEGKACEIEGGTFKIIQSEDRE